MSFRLRAVVWLVGGLLLLQAADFVFTWLLLSSGARADVYESNPLARSILDSTGWLGLGAFKLAITAVVLLAVVAVACRRRLAAVRLLVGLCLLMLGVNVYSGTLLASPDQTAADQRQTQAHEEILRDRLDHLHEFIRLRDQLCDDVLADRLSLAESVLKLTDHVRHYTPLLRLPPAGRLPHPSRSDEVALYFDYHLRHRAIERGLDDTSAPRGVTSNDPMTPLWLRVSLAAN